MTKTAVSIPAPLFAAADALAHKLQMSRSALYARALRRFLREEREAQVTQRLNAVYDVVDSTLDPRIAAAQTAALDDDEW